MYLERLQDAENCYTCEFNQNRLINKECLCAKKNKITKHAKDDICGDYTAAYEGDYNDDESG